MYKLRCRFRLVLWSDSPKIHVLGDVDVSFAGKDGVHQLRWGLHHLHDGARYGSEAKQ